MCVKYGQTDTQTHLSLKKKTVTNKTNRCKKSAVYVNKKKLIIGSFCLPSGAIDHACGMLSDEHTLRIHDLVLSLI